jgi:glutaredoxin
MGMNIGTSGALRRTKKRWFLIVSILSESWRWPALCSYQRPAQLLTPNTPGCTRSPNRTAGGHLFLLGRRLPTHCAAAKPVLAELTRKYPSAQVRAYEVWYVEENQTLFKQMAAAYGFEPSAVPTIFIGDRHWVGYAEQVAPEIESAVAECAATGCRDAGMGIIPGIPTPIPTPIPTVLAAPAVAVAALGAAVQAPPSVAPAQPETSAQLVLPWFGAIDLAAPSLAVSTALIALVDGFNPCSLWVLSVLLALTLNSGSRRKVFLVGFVFLTVTSLVYMAFITGLFTMFTVISFVGWIQIVVAVVALFFAA